MKAGFQEKVYTQVQTSLIIYIYLELGGAAQRWRKKKVMADFYSSIQNASIDASLFREGFLEEATEAERHDGDEIASPHQRVKKRSLPCSAPSIGNESDICSKTHVCASSFCSRMIRSILETALASHTEIIRTYIDLTNTRGGGGRGRGGGGGAGCLSGLIDSVTAAREL